MPSFFQNFVKRTSLTSDFSQRENGIKEWLILVNILLVFFLILLFNTGILPFQNWGNFGFFSVIVFILTLYRPWWGFLFFIGTIMLENINLAPETIGIEIRPYQFFGSLTILAVLVRILFGKLDFKIPKFLWIDLMPILFCFAGFVSALGAEDKILAFKQSVIIASFVALYFLTRIFIQSLDDIKKILPFFLSSSFVIVLYGIWQNWQFLHNGNYFEIMPGRPNATFAEADWLGIFLALVLSVAYSLVFNNFKFKILDKGKRKNLLLITGYWLLIIMVFILTILTVSRSAWLGAGVVSGLYLVFCIWEYFRKKDFKILQIPIFAGIAFLLAFAFVKFVPLSNFELGNRLQSVGSGLQEITVSCVRDLKTETQDSKPNREELPKIIRNVSDLERYACRHINLEEIESEKKAGNIIVKVYREDPNVNIRGEIYQKAWRKIKEHPFFGIGWGNIGKILGVGERGESLNASNIFLEVWLGAGVLGLVSFTLILVGIFLKSVNSIRWSAEKKHNLKVWNLFLLLSFFAIVVPNLFNAGIMLGFLWLWLGATQAESDY